MAQLKPWVAHGVLWHIINPLWAGLRDLGFKEKLLDDASVANNEIGIKDTLQQWHEYLNPEQLYQRFEDELSRVQRLPIEQRLQRWVHGKMFYKQVVTPCA